MGDSINMAARLMCLPIAQGSVVCDEKTRNLCQSEYIFSSCGQVNVKGKNHPIAAFLPMKPIMKKKADGEVTAFALHPRSCPRLDLSELNSITFLQLSMSSRRSLCGMSWNIASQSSSGHEASPDQASTTATSIGHFHARRH